MPLEAIVIPPPLPRANWKRKRQRNLTAITMLVVGFVAFGLFFLNQSRLHTLVSNSVPAKAVFTPWQSTIDKHIASVERSHVFLKWFEPEKLDANAYYVARFENLSSAQRRFSDPNGIAVRVVWETDEGFGRKAQHDRVFIFDRSNNFQTLKRYDPIYDPDKSRHAPMSLLPNDFFIGKPS